MRNILPVGIVAVGAYAPPKILTNKQLESIVDTSDEWIRTRSGIETRHIADEGMATSDVAYASAVQALERAQLAPADLDLIVVATFTPDSCLPSTACLLQDMLGATNAAAFDINAACTGFIYALSVAQAQVATGMYRNALVLGVDLLSRFTDYQDRGTCVLFGDGGGAAVLKQVPEGRGIIDSYLRADGSKSDLLSVPAGGSRHPASHETVDARDHYIRMNGKEVYRFAINAIEEAANIVLERNGFTHDDVSLVILHQANIRIIEAAAKRLDIPLDRWLNNIQEYGNTSAGSIPLAFNQAYEQNKIKEGDLILLVGFGGGLTWGSMLLRW